MFTSGWAGGGVSCGNLIAITSFNLTFRLSCVLKTSPVWTVFPLCSVFHGETTCINKGDGDLVPLKSMKVKSNSIIKHHAISRYG